MTEEEWVGADDQTIRRIVMHMPARKQRLLAAACCRALGDLVNHPAASAALDAIEVFADTGKSKAALRRHRQAVRAVRYEGSPKSVADRGSLSGNVLLALWAVEVAASENAAWSAVQDAERAMTSGGLEKDLPVLRREYFLYRDITGKYSAFAPSWRSPDAAGLAASMYLSRDFAAMPILADALEEAGCDNAAILAHCRDAAGVHVRGCWVVDLVLGKS